MKSTLVVRGWRIMGRTNLKNKNKNKTLALQTNQVSIQQRFTGGSHSRNTVVSVMGRVVVDSDDDSNDNDDRQD